MTTVPALQSYFSWFIAVMMLQSCSTTTPEPSINLGSEDSYGRWASGSAPSKPVKTETLAEYYKRMDEQYATLAEGRAMLEEYEIFISEYRKTQDKAERIRATENRKLAAQAKKEKELLKKLEKNEEVLKLMDNNDKLWNFVMGSSKTPKTGFVNFCRTFELKSCSPALSYDNYMGLLGRLTDSESVVDASTGQRLFPVVLETGEQFYFRASRAESVSTILETGNSEISKYNSP